MHNKEDKDPRQYLIVSTGKYKQRQASKHNRNTDETGQLKAEKRGNTNQ